ncbi:GFA family protein [Thalassobaculum sp. OXR-137]|uniref:GFA family protein n=1 Tax=Thalassobaculum sp. OXR-137 TaxID=3100173 RepID=UPI002AC9ED3A|nr:GFA family protein [Thalassobaculum sp. OXR-137]WPZ34388.1 GFA family protein [Thalassobaculum sp. OXR-137]
MAEDSAGRTARCGCGALSVRVTGEPLEVYACSCLNCQRETGGVFTYTASYLDAAAIVTGQARLWRRIVPSGRWIETSFCPTCGTQVFQISELQPGVICIAVGCFADPAFPAPRTLYFGRSCHRWLVLPEEMRRLATQPD